MFSYLNVSLGVFLIKTTDCSEVRQSGMDASGVYTTQPLDQGGPVQVYIDMDTGCGSWTVSFRMCILY